MRNAVTMFTFLIILSVQPFAISTVCFPTSFGSCCTASDSLNADQTGEQHFNQEMQLSKVVTNSSEPIATSIDILQPSMAIPAIVVKGDDFSIITESNASSGSSWEARIISAYDSYSLVILGFPIELSNDSWSLNVSVPIATRPDLYNLSITVDGSEDIQSHAVSIVESLSDRFKFIQVTDVHVGALATGSAYDNFIRLIDEINLIHPQFVVFTGDLCDKYLSGQEFPPEQQDELFVECLMHLQVPAFVGSGNHDWSYVNSSNPNQNIEKYRSTINRYLNFSFDYGSYHFSYLDTGIYSIVDYSTGVGISNETIEWLRSDLENHTMSTQSFVLLHHPVYPDWLSQNEVRFTQLMEDSNVSMVLAGHIHYDAVYDRNGTQKTGGNVTNMTQPMYVSTEGMKYSHAYRLITINKDKIESFTYDEDGNGVRDAASSIPMGFLNVSYTPSNIGISNKVTATINNGLRENFNDIFLEFFMPKSTPGSSLIVKNGTVMQKIELTSVDVYYVQANVSKLWTTKVTLILEFPAGEFNLMFLIAAFTAGVILCAIPRRKLR